MDIRAQEGFGGCTRDGGVGRAAVRAIADHGVAVNRIGAHCAHRYPRGVTIRPPTIRVWLAPITTRLYMSTTVGSKSASVVRIALWSGRLALRTTPTGVVGGRCSASSSRARPNCQSRLALRGL